MVKIKVSYFFVVFSAIFSVLVVFIVGFNNVYVIKNPYLNNKNSTTVNLDGLSVSDLVAAKLAYATSKKEPFELAVFGNSRSVMLGTEHIAQWKRNRAFNFSVGGTAFQQSVRSLEYLAQHGVAPKTAVISIDNAELQFVGSPYWPQPLFDGFRIFQDISSLLREDYAGFHQRLKDSVKLAEYFTNDGWHHFKSAWSFDTMLRRARYFFGEVDVAKIDALASQSDGSRRPIIAKEPPNLKAFRPSTSGPRAVDRYLLIGLRRLAVLAEQHGTRIIVYESPLAPELASIYTARSTDAASETRRWMALGCMAANVECHAAPVLRTRVAAYWPDCCHAPAVVLGKYVSDLIANRRPN
jgi:hypothetical protein